MNRPKACLLVLEEPLWLAAEEVDQLGEIDTREEHEDGGGPLDRGIVADHTVVAGGESARRDGAQRVTDGVEKGHALEVQQGYLGDGQDDVCQPHVFGGVGDSRTKFLVTHAGHLSAIELHAAEAEHRQDSDGEDDDSHTSEPLHQRSPEEDRVGHGGHVADDGSAGGGEARHGLKPCVRQFRQRAAEPERKHAEERIDHPDGRHDDVPFAFTDVPLCVTAGKQHPPAAEPCDGARHHPCA